MLRVIISAIKWSAIIILISIALLSSIFISSQTRYGKDMLVRIVDLILNERYGIGIEVSGLSGAVPYDITIDRMVLSDGSGPWLEIHNLAFRFPPLYLFRGRLLVESLDAESVAITRLPEVKKSGATGGQSLLLPSIAYRIGLKDLNISRLSLPEEVLGRPADFIIKAGITEEEVGFKSRVFVNIDRTDGIAGTAYLNAEIEGTDPYLVINAGIDEHERGIIGALAHIEAPLSMSFKGSGRIKDWNGELSVNADTLADINADIYMSAQDDLHVNLEGRARLGPGLIPETLHEFQDNETVFKINARIRDKREILLDLARFQSGAALLELTGALDVRAMTSEGSFTAALEDVSPLGRLINKECSGHLAINGDFKGPVSSPSADVSIKVRDLDFDIIRVNEFNAKATLDHVTSGGSPDLALHLKGSGDLQGLYIMSLSNEPIPQGLGWDLEMTWPKEKDLELESLHLNTGLLTAGVSGIFNIRDNKGSIKARLKADSLEGFSGFVHRDIPGGIGAVMDIDGIFSGPSLEADIAGKILVNSDADKTILDIMGHETGYATYLSLSDQGLLRFSNGIITSEKAGLSFSGQYDTGSGEIHGLLGLETDNLGAFSNMIGREARGSARISATLDGTTEDTDLTLEFNGNDLALDNAVIGLLSCSISLSGTPLENQGRITLSLNQNGSDLKGSSLFRRDNSLLSFQDISFSGQGFSLRGNLSADTEAVSARGELYGDLTDLSIINAFLGREIKGRASLHLKADTASGINTVRINIRGEDISDALGRADTLDMDLELSGDLKNPDISASASVTGLENSDISLKSTVINARGKPQELDFTLRSEGKFVYGIILEASGDISLSPSGRSIGLNSFRGEYGILPVYLAGPFRVTSSDTGIEFEPMEFNLAGGTIAAYGSLNKGSVNLNMNFKNIPASLLDLAGINQLEGNANCSIVISGSPEQPNARAAFAFDDMRLRDAAYSKLPSMSLAGNALLESGRLDTDITLDSRSGEPFKLDISVPVTLSFSPFSFAFPEDEDINGRVSGEMDLTNIMTLTGIYNQKFTGRLNIGLDIAGTVKSPIITGDAGIENGGYENYTTGTLIKDITMDISLDSKRFVLNKIKGTDGDQGKVSGNGWFEFAPSRNFPYSLSLNLKNMMFYRSSTLSFAVSGKPTISGTLSNHTISGRLSIEKGEYRIPERLPAEITDLEVTEINGPEQGVPQDREQAMRRSVMNMDLSVESAGQVYLTGRGLNSEWEGNIIIKGTTDAPVITGSLSVLRGSYNFLGKRFDLTEGRIDLDGTYPLKPYIDVTGEAQTNDITAIINLAGELKKPEVTLSSSDSSLPSDEILSQLLFGKDVSQISPLQAIELGNALNSMMGKSKYDIVGNTRKMLGVDQLDLVQSEEDSDESAVSVGKYLREDLYIELEKGLGAESGKASVTWEATPNITVDTEMRENSSNGIGINWKWDY